MALPLSVLLFSIMTLKKCLQLEEITTIKLKISQRLRDPHLLLCQGVTLTVKQVLKLSTIVVKSQICVKVSIMHFLRDSMYPSEMHTLKMEWALQTQFTDKNPRVEKLYTVTTEAIWRNMETCPAKFNWELTSWEMLLTRKACLDLFRLRQSLTVIMGLITMFKCMIN